MSDSCDIFVSVGSAATDQQEAFICAVEARLRAEGLTPHTVGRDTFSADAPLKAVTELMERCTGAVVIALERSFFPQGLDKPGPKQSPLANVKLPTPWNQIEAAMAYSRKLPLLMIVEKGLRTEGLLQRGYDWYVQEVAPDAASLSSVEFNGVLSDWKRKVQSRPLESASQNAAPVPLEAMSVGQLLGSVKPAQLWSVLAALAAAIVGAFTVGAKLFAGK